MSHITCPCGNSFSFVAHPNVGMHVIKDEDYADYTRAVWRTYQMSDVERAGMLPDVGSAESEEFHSLLERSLNMEGELIHCGRCGRLLWRRPGEVAFTSFLPEK